MRANYGITRVDQPAKKNHGYVVRICHCGTLHTKYFPDKSSGGKTKALTLAKARRDEILANLPDKEIPTQRRAIPQSDVSGVTHIITNVAGHSYTYWQASWRDARGFRRTAKFRIAKYGEARARMMAEQSAKAKSKCQGVTI